MVGDFWRCGVFTRNVIIGFCRETSDQLPNMCTKINVPKITFLFLEPQIWF